MNTTSRERLLMWVFGLIGIGVLGYVLIGMLLLPFLHQRKTNRDLEADIAATESEYESTQRRNKKVMAEILPRSLPADLDFSKREYQAALTRLLLESRVPAGFTVRDKAPDTRGIPELVKNRPAYKKIAYSIEISKVDIATLMTFLKKYYDLNLLHQITNFTIKRENASEIGADSRPAKERADLNVSIVTEALMLDGAPARKTLLAAPVSAGSVLSGAGAYSLEYLMIDKPDLGRGIAPYQISQILANPAREYAHVIAKDPFHGKLPVPPPDKPKEKEKVVEIPPGPDIGAYIQLVTLVKSSDGTAHVEIFDKWNNYDFEINMVQKGEKLAIEAMRYMKTKKSNFYPDGRMKDPTFPKAGNLLAFSDDKSSTNRTFKIYGVDGHALILGETAAEPKGGGKFTKPPTDIKPAVLGGLFAGVPVPKGEKFYRWEVGVPLKGIKELTSDEARKSIERALGGLLEAAPVSVPAPMVPPMPEIAPKPNAVLVEGK